MRAFRVGQPGSTMTKLRQLFPQWPPLDREILPGADVHARRVAGWWENHQEVTV
jgi:hypothetical protein